MAQHMSINKHNITHKQNHIISIDAEKAFSEIQHPFMIKALKKLAIENTFLNTIKAIFDKSIANILLLFNIVLEFLARARNFSFFQEKEIKGIQIRKKQNCPYLQMI
jgi:hypothetical protein